MLQQRIINIAQDKKKSKSKIVVTIILLAVFLVFLLFPRRNDLLDGGTVIYRSFAFGSIYQVEHLHRFYDENGYAYFEKGFIITVFGKEVFNNTYVDYEDGRPLEHSPEVEVWNKEIDKVLAIQI